MAVPGEKVCANSCCWLHRDEFYPSTRSIRSIGLSMADRTETSIGRREREREGEREREKERKRERERAGTWVPGKARQVLSSPIQILCAPAIRHAFPFGSYFMPSPLSLSPSLVHFSGETYVLQVSEINDWDFSFNGESLAFLHGQPDRSSSSFHFMAHQI